MNWKESIKVLRRLALDAYWSVRGQKPPQQALTFNEWLRLGGEGRLHSLREAITVPFPPRSRWGQTEQIAPALARMSADCQAMFRPQANGLPHRSYPQQGVAVIREGRVFSSLGLVLSAEDYQLRDLSGGAFDGLFTHPLIYRGRIPSPRRVRGSVAVLACGAAQRNYYHWTVEVLPRLGLLAQAGIEPDYYFVPRRYPFHYNSLELLGIPRERLIPAGKYTHIQASELIVPQSLGEELDPASARYLYETMAGMPWSQTRAPRQRIYIARRRRECRHVINEAELLKALETRGFVSHALEDYPVRKQIELFQSAGVVVGPHGAGLVNTVYCHPGTQVLEIGSPARPCSLFHEVAFHRGLAFHTFFGSAVKQRQAESNIHVDVPAFMQCLDGMLDQRAAA